MKMSARFTAMVGWCALMYATATIGQDFIPIKYKFTSIDVPGATQTHAYGNNNKGAIVGDYTDAQGKVHGFLYEKGTFTSIDCALQNATQLTAINKSREIVGTYSFNGGTHGFIYEGNGSCTDIVVNLPGANGATTMVWGLNDNGQIVGFYQDSSQNYQGFLYDNKKFSQVVCGTQTRAYGITNGGVILGDFEDANGWHGMQRYAVNGCDVFDDRNASWTSAKARNRVGRTSGWIIGLTDGHFHGYVKKPSGHRFKEFDYKKDGITATDTLFFHINAWNEVVGWYIAANGMQHGLLATPKQ